MQGEQSPFPPQRQAPPPGTRRVYSCVEESGVLQTVCTFENTTCIYDKELASKREVLLKVPNIFQRTMASLVEETTYSPIDCLKAVVDDVINKEKPQMTDCEQEQALSRNFEVIRSLMRLHRRIVNLAHSRIGKLVNDLDAANPDVPRRDIVTSLCNRAGRAKEMFYTSALTRCSQAGCDQCTATKVFDSQGRQEQPPVLPCSATQALCRIMDLDFQNFTPSFFRQCADVAALPFHSPVVTSCEAPSCVRTVVAPTARRMFEEIATHPRASLTTGCVPVFSLGRDKSAVEAVQYSDGDGGFIVVEHFDFFGNYLQKLSSRPRLLHLEMHDYHMLPFREVHHDALELSHQYEVSSEDRDTLRTYQWGYEALIKARGNMQCATRLWIVPSTMDASGDRLLLELFTLEKGEMLPSPTGVRLLEAGLSYLTRNSPRLYQEAWSRGRECEAGIHEHNLGVPQLHPIELKQNLRKDNPSATVEVEVMVGSAVVSCTVKNNAKSDILNEANIWILKSVIPDAGLGLFLKPTALSQRHFVIPETRGICVYSGVPITDPVSDMISTDYLIESKCGREMRRFNPMIYDGKNIGRFVNQGGLMEGIKEMCMCCDLRSGGKGIEPGRINTAMRAHCNVTYRLHQRSTLYVVPISRLVSTNSPQELLANYDYTYWTRFIASHSRELGYDTPMVLAVLWCYLSRHSAHCNATDIDLSHVPENIKMTFRDMDCPISRSRSRQRRTV